MIGVVATIRQEVNKAAQSESVALRYYISSGKLSAKERLEGSRAHRSIEVQLQM